MTIKVTALGTSYLDPAQLPDMLHKEEGFLEVPYDDGKHIPTIGIGIALQDKNGATHTGNLALVLGKIGVFAASDAAAPVNETSIERALRYQRVLTQFAQAIGSQSLSRLPSQAAGTSQSEIDLKAALDSLVALYDPSGSFSLDLPQAKQVKVEYILGYVIGPFSSRGAQAELDKRIAGLLAPAGQPVPHDTREYMALMSLFFSGPNLIGSGLTTALAQENRAEAWYEIRYGSNNEPPAVQDGIAKRRYYEASVFGLHDAVAADPATAAQNVYRMLELHRGKIEDYERKFSAQISEANSANGYSLAGTQYEIQTLDDSLQPSVQPLLDWVNSQLPLGSMQLDASMIDSPLGIHLNPGRNNAALQVSTLYDAFLDARRYLAPGSNTELELRNILVGEDGDDRFIGGKGDDVLVGGLGEDKYFFATGDGQDTIIDVDGYAEIIRNGTQVVFGYQSGVDVWTQPASDAPAVTFRKLGPGTIADLELVFADSQTDKIIIKNFDFLQAKADYYGIKLIDAPSAPNDPLRIFLGDKQDWDSDPNESGTQTQLDAFGNVIRADGQGDPARPDLPEADRGDFFYGSDSPDVERFITAGGNDTVYADGAASTTSTQGGDDIVEAGAGSDIIAGGAGDDWIEGGTGDDILAGNEGKDSLFAESSNGGTLTIDLAIAQGESGEPRPGQGDLLSGDAGDDVLISDAGADFLAGGVGEEIIVGGAGDDTIYGDGTVTSALLGWSVSRTRSEVNGVSVFTVDRTGINLVQDDAVGNLDVIYGGAGDDWILAGAADDYVEGGIGDDVLFGEAGHDVLVGGDGNDVLAGDSLPVDTAGLSGDDYLVGGAGDDELHGNKGNDYLDGGDGFDIISGGDGDDTLVGGAGPNWLVGGAGKDRYVYNAGDGKTVVDDEAVGADDPEASVLVLGPGIAPEDVKFRPNFLVVDLGDGNLIQFLHFDPQDPLSTPVIDAIEFQSGGFMTLDDVLEQGFDLDGDDNDNILFGTPYVDRFDAKGGNDRVTGRAGDDSILGGAGDDWLEGNDGNDTMDGGAGSDELTGGWGDDALQGGDDDDALAGDGGNDTLEGGAGADSLAGHSGDDILTGGAGDDLLIGNDGSDTYTFSAGNGNDLIDEQAQIAVGVADEAGVDIVRFDASVTPGAVTLSRSASGDLTIGYGTSDTVTVIGQYTGAAQAMERIEFDDGSFIDKAALDAVPVASIQGTAGADTLSGTPGNDTLEGGAGADAYAMYLGMGRDTLIDASPSGEVSTLSLAEGLALDSLKARQVGDDLLVDIRGTSDGVVVKDYFASGSTQTWQIEEAGGTLTAMQDLIDRPDPYAGNIALGAREDFRQGLLAAWATETVNSPLPSHALISNGWSQTTFHFLGGGGIAPYTEALPPVVSFALNGYGIRNGAYFSPAPLVHHSIEVLATSQSSDDATITAQSQAQQSSEILTYGVTPGNIIPGYGAQSFSSTGTVVVAANAYNIIVSRTNTGWAPINLVSGSGAGYPATLAIEEIDEIRTLEDITGGASANVIYGAAGISAGHVALIDAGEGNDEVHAGPDDFAYGGEGDDAIYGGALVYGGNGADTLEDGSIQYGGAGNDTLSGGAFMAGGSGDDTMTGEEGATTFFFDPAEIGADVVQDVAGISLDELETWYYESIGVYDDDYAQGGMWAIAGESLDDLQDLYFSPEDYPGHESQAFTETKPLDSEVDIAVFYYLSVDDLRADLATVGAPFRPEDVRYLLPLNLLASDYGALERFHDAGLIERDTVEFGEGVALNDLTLTWNIVDVEDPITGLDVPHAALELSWGPNNSVSIAIPRAADLIGTGIEQFRFADGTLVSMAEMLELAPQPGPAIPVEGSVLDDGLFGTQDNEILTGYDGDDSIEAGGGNDVLVGGDGEDSLDGADGSDRYVYEASETGIDNLNDSGSNTEAYLGWYYRSQGLENWRLRPEYVYPGQYRIYRGIENGYEYFETFEEAADAAAADRNQPVHFVAPASVVAPLVTRNDTATLAQLSVEGVLDRDVVSFGTGLNLQDLEITVSVFGPTAEAHPEQPWYGGGTLSVRWNSGLAGFDVAVPNVVFGDTGAGYFEDDWEDYELGKGIEAFEFADGSSYTLEEFLLQATVALRYGYLFERNSGAQVIEGEWTGVDFEPGIDPSEVVAERNGIDLVFRLTDFSAEATVPDWYLDPGAIPPWQFRFDDGTVFDTDTITRLGLTQVGTSGMDFLDGDPDFASALYGLESSDWLTGGNGNDLLDGGPGNDPVLQGLGGNDIYVFDVGYGEDAIYESFYDDGSGFDVVRFGTGVSTQDVSVDQDEGNLVLTIGEGADALMIGSWFDEPGGSVEAFEFADGTAWDTATVLAMLPAKDPATEGDDILWGGMGDDILDGLGGNDEVWGFAGDDTLYGGAGDDFLDGGSGNDLVFAGDGFDWADAYGPGVDLMDLGADDDGATIEDQSVVIGGTGDDWIEVYGAGALVLFNAGDGNDTLYLDAEAFTLSLGGGVSASDLSLARAGDDVTLQIGLGDSIVFTGDFGGAPVYPETMLQLFGSAHLYDFDTLLYDFLAQESQNPGLVLSLDGVLGSYEIASSQTDALGGAIAWEYANTGSLAALTEAQIRTVLSNPSFGIALQSMTLPSGNSAPVVASAIADQSANEDAAFSFAIPAGTFSDPDTGDILTYAATLDDGSVLPAWLSFDAETQTFSGTPLQANVGAMDVKVTAADGGGLSADDTFTLTVQNVNDAPVVSAADAELLLNDSTLASTLFSVFDEDGQSPTQYEFWDDVAGGGRFEVTGVEQGAATAIAVSAADLANTEYVAGSTPGTERVWVRAYDGAAWSAWKSWNMTSALHIPNAAPEATPTAATQTVLLDQSVAVASLFSVLDADGDPAARYEFWDSTADSGFFAVNGVEQAIDTAIVVDAADLANATFVGGTEAGSDLVWVRATDGQTFGAWKSWTMNSWPHLTNAAPVADAPDGAVLRDQAVLAQSLFSVTDADEDAITAYEFWDDTTGGGYFAVDGVEQTNNPIPVSAAQLADVEYVGGADPGTEQVWVRAYDGLEWGAWESWNMTSALHIPNAAPEATPAAATQTVLLGQTVAASSLFSVLDADGDPAVRYELWDSSAGNGHFTVNGVEQGVNVAIVVDAADLAAAGFVGAASASSDQVWVRATDGQSFGAWVSWTMNSWPHLTNAAPVADAQDATILTGETVAAASLFSVSDADGDAPVRYEFWDDVAAGGYWRVNGVQQAAATAIAVEAADLANTEYVGGANTGSEQVWVRVNDGMAWGAWESWTMNSWPHLTNEAPVVTAANSTLLLGQSTDASSLFSVTDADEDAISQYEFWDSTAGNGHFTVSGVEQGVNVAIGVTAAQLADTDFVAAASTGSDSVWVRAHDGMAWSDWKSWTMNSWPHLTNAVPVVSASNSGILRDEALSAGMFFGVSDADGDAAVQFEFWDDVNGGGYWSLEGVQQAYGQAIPVTAAQLADLDYVGAANAGTEQVWVRANDAMGWSAWKNWLMATEGGMLRGGDGPDTLNGEAGPTVLQGGGGNDTLTDTDGDNLFSGGDGDDAMTGGDGDDLFAGGSGNDTINTGGGSNIIAYNAGGGIDTVYAAAGASNTLSFGGGIDYDDLALSKDGNDLIVSVGPDGQVVFKDWYAGSASVLNLQIVHDASDEFDANSTDPLYNKKVQTFDFAGLVSEFDDALAQSPGLTSWAVTNALLEFHLSGSDDAAIGGDLAYWYGKNAGFTGISLQAAQQVLGSPGFGSDAQSLQPFSGLQEGFVKLA